MPGHLTGELGTGAAVGKPASRLTAARRRWQQGGKVNSRLERCRGSNTRSEHLMNHPFLHARSVAQKAISRSLALGDIGRNGQFSQDGAELLDCNWVRGYQECKCDCHDEVTFGIGSCLTNVSSQFDCTPAGASTIVTRDQSANPRYFVFGLCVHNPTLRCLRNKSTGSTENILAPRCPIATLARLSTRTCEEPSNHDSSGRHRRALTFLKK